MNCADRSLVGRSAVAGRSPAGEERGSRSSAAGSASCIEVAEAVGCSRSPEVAGEAAAVENTAAGYIVRYGRVEDLMRERDKPAEDIRPVGRSLEVGRSSVAEGNHPAGRDHCRSNRWRT
jgi:hypothetical protein